MVLQKTILGFERMESYPLSKRAVGVAALGTIAAKTAMAQ